MTKKPIINIIIIKSTNAAVQESECETQHERRYFRLSITSCYHAILNHIQNREIVSAVLGSLYITWYISFFPLQV